MLGHNRQCEHEWTRFVHSVGTTLWTKTVTWRLTVETHPVDDAVDDGGKPGSGCGAARTPR
jgi:hypothetical protein